MTPELIQRMATQAGFNPQEYRSWGDDLTKFAALVAAHEREECAQYAENYSDPRDGPDSAADTKAVASACAAAIRGRTG